MNQTLDDLEKFQNIEAKPSKEKKRLKWILISLGLIVGFGILRFLTMLLIGQIIVTYFSDTLLRIFLIFSFLISLFLEILIVYFIILLITKKTGGGNKLKNSLKIILFVLLPILLLSTFAFSTKSGIIPNRLNIEMLEIEEMPIIKSMNYGCYDDPTTPGGKICFDKPIIYLYPMVETEVQIELGTPENLTHTYPKYNSEKGWNVIAQPNGDLKDIDTGRKLYALYREGKNETPTNFDEGFVVKGEDTIPFLEEKLAILGLNEREAEEFIVYRLPQMEGNEWNLIKFETKAEQDENMPLNITPKPDTMIRIMMDWKAIDEPIDIPKQQLTTPERTGFTVVEWGGSHRN